MDVTQRTRVTNSGAGPMLVSMEPWGDRVRLAPGESLDFVFAAETEGEPEIETVADGVVVWAWSGSTMKAVKDGETIVDYGDLRVPDVPPGMRTSGFLRMVLGQPSPSRGLAGRAWAWLTGRRADTAIPSVERSRTFRAPAACIGRF